MSIPKLSVIIPVYNVERYLDQAIRSVADQPCKDMEIILVDDGSRDKSGVMCDGYAKADSRITVIHKENGGVSSARNAGLDVAKGEWVAFLDSDDIWFPDFYDDRLKQLLTVRSEDCFIFKHAKGDENANIVKYVGGRPATDNELFFVDQFDKEFCSILYRRTMLNRLHISVYEGLKYGEDRIFLSNALRCSEFKYVDRMIFVYRNNPTSATNKKVSAEDVYIPLIAARKYYADYYRSVCINEQLARMNEVCMFGTIVEYMNGALMDFKSVKHIEYNLKNSGYIDFYYNYAAYDLPSSILYPLEKFQKCKFVYVVKYKLIGFVSKIKRIFR